MFNEQEENMTHAFDDMFINRSLERQRAAMAAEQAAKPMDKYLRRTCGTPLPPAPKGFKVQTGMDSLAKRKGWRNP